MPPCCISLLQSRPLKLWYCSAYHESRQVSSKTHICSFPRHAMIDTTATPLPCSYTSAPGLQQLLYPYTSRYRVRLPCAHGLPTSLHAPYPIYTECCVTNSCDVGSEHPDSNKLRQWLGCSGPANCATLCASCCTIEHTQYSSHPGQVGADGQTSTPLTDSPRQTPPARFPLPIAHRRPRSQTPVHTPFNIPSASRPCTRVAHTPPVTAAVLRVNTPCRGVCGCEALTGAYPRLRRCGGAGCGSCIIRGTATAPAGPATPAAQTCGSLRSAADAPSATQSTTCLS